LWQQNKRKTFEIKFFKSLNSRKIALNFFCQSLKAAKLGIKNMIGTYDSEFGFSKKREQKVVGFRV
jgi:hypothetical protein